MPSDLAKVASEEEAAKKSASKQQKKSKKKAESEKPPSECLKDPNFLREKTVIEVEPSAADATIIP